MGPCAHAAHVVSCVFVRMLNQLSALRFFPWVAGSSCLGHYRHGRISLAFDSQMYEECLSTAERIPERKSSPHEVAVLD